MFVSSCKFLEAHTGRKLAMRVAVNRSHCSCAWQSSSRKQSFLSHMNKRWTLNVYSVK